MAATLLAPQWCDAQDTSPAETPAPSVAEKWQFFQDETVAPFTLLASGITAGVSQAARSDPQYGAGARSLAERFGAVTGDNIAQNFFSDFLLASAFHEDTRYRPKGQGHGFWPRFGYALSRAFVTRTDRGDRTVNWSNLLGCGLQAGLSNAYYPPPSRNVPATAINWANSVAGSGFGNLFPEFLPDFKRLLKRLHL
ncbi:MAG TPA: hypothetical protein VKR61_00260 [Bryobacteraceae bacterium]|nr:hypothetical protein [Bryobacteraceae bacterium]